MPAKQEHSPFKRLISGTVIYGLGTVLVQMINIILMPLLTVYLNPREYGVVALLNFTSLFLYAIFSLGIGSSIGICYFEKNEDSWRDRVISSSFFTLLASGTLLVIVALLGLPYWPIALLTTSEFDTACFFMVLATLALMLLLPFDSKLRLDERAGRFVLASLLSTLSIGFLTLWFVIGLKQGVHGYFGALLCGRIISLIVFYGLSQARVVQNFFLSTARQLLFLGVPLVPQFVFLYILQYGSIELLKRYSGLAAAGVYSAGLTIGLASNFLISSIASAWAPFFLSYTNKQNEAGDLFARITKYYIYAVGLFSFFFYYFSKILVIGLSAPQYYQAHEVVGPVASSMFMLGLFNMFLPPVYFAKEVGKITYCALLAVLSLVSLGWILIPSFGLQGAAWSGLVAYTIHTFLLLLWNVSQKKRYFAIPYEVHRLGIFLIFYFGSCFILGQLNNLDLVSQIAIYVSHLAVSLLIIFILLGKHEISAISKIITVFRHAMFDKGKII